MLSPEGFEARSLHKPTSGGSHLHNQTRSPDLPEAKHTHLLGKRVTLADPYDTSPLHIFIRENFQDAFLVEEHQVCVIFSRLYLEYGAYENVWMCQFHRKRGSGNQYK